MEKKHLIEEALKKFASLDDEAKEFALGYVTGKHDEKQATKSGAGGGDPAHPSGADPPRR